MLDSPDLYALVIHLRVAADGSLPRHIGHQAQALFLELLRQVDPACAAAMHADAPTKPFTVATFPLPGVEQHAEVALRRGATIVLRVTLLQSDLFAPFTRALLSQLPSQPTLRLGALPLILADVRGTTQSDAWAGFASFAELAAAAQPAQRLTLHFAAPTAFAQSSSDDHERVALLPDPQTVFGALLRRWNAWAPEHLQLDQAAIEQSAYRALVSSYDLHTLRFGVGKALQIGFVGTCSYRLIGSPEEQRQLALLADAAFYLGLGKKTARGMGMCRRMNGEEVRR